MAGLIPENIKELIEAKLAEHGYELFESKFFQAGSRGVLRITIDAPDGVTIADCEKASKELSIMLDVEDFSSTRPYTLEISTPGIDRRLTTERDFRRTVGRFVVCQMAPEYAGKRTVRGKVTGCTAEKLSCEVEGTVIELPLQQVIYGKEEIQFK
jgi:ribosome maturation factor RimP